MELPELKILGNQMMKKIKGKVISEVEIANPKCLNLPLEEFRSVVISRRIEGVESKGKWLFMKLNPDQFLLFNPGMGADII